MKRRIIDGPHLHEAPTDGTLWVATIENTNDPAQRRVITAVISGSALESDPASLPIDVQEAIVSNGRTAIEKYLDEQQPPYRIAVLSLGVQPE